LHSLSPPEMAMIRTPLIFHIAAVEFSAASVPDLGFEDTDINALNLIQLRAHSHSIDPDEDACTLVQGDAVSTSFAPAYEAMNGAYVDSDSWITPGGTGTPVQSLEECIDRVKQMNALSVSRNQPPVCTGLSLPTGGQGQCYCQRGISGTDGNPGWQSCKFGGFSEEDLWPTTDKQAAEELGCFFVAGWGNGRTRKIGDVNSKAECINMAKEQCPDATGISMGRIVGPVSLSPCVCDFDSTGSNGKQTWQYCHLGDEPEPIVFVGGENMLPIERFVINDGAGFDGSCDWYPGDTNGREVKTPKATSPAHCAQLVRQQCPDANAASLRISGSGDCYCEIGATNSRAPEGNGVGGARTTWQSCILPPATTTTEPTTTTTVAGEASAVGDPHMSSNHVHSDLCCHQGDCKPCEA